MLARMFSISWPRDPPASASQSAGITGVSHRAQPIKNSYNEILLSNKNGLSLHTQISNAFCWVKEASFKQLYTVWFYSLDISKQQNNGDGLVLCSHPNLMSDYKSRCWKRGLVGGEWITVVDFPLADLLMIEFSGDLAVWKCVAPPPSLSLPPAGHVRMVLASPLSSAIIVSFLRPPKPCFLYSLQNHESKLSSSQITQSQVCLDNGVRMD